MPVIGVAAGLPGTGIGVDVKLAHQTPREKEADQAMEIHERGSRDIDAMNEAIRDKAGTLDRLLGTASPLDRFVDQSAG